MLNAYGSYQFPDDSQIKLDWDSDGQLIYRGVSGLGISTVDGEWLIYKYTWAEGNLTSKQTAVGAWDSRTLLTYA